MIDALRVKAVRRVAIIAIIVSLSLTALIGIFTLLTSAFDQTTQRVMLTTLTIGVFSVLSLCDLAVLGRRLQLVGITGILVNAIALVFGLILVWGDVTGPESEFLWKTFGLAAIVGVSLAHATLLLLLGERRQPVVRIGLWVTVGLIAILIILLALLILTDGEVGTDAYGRLVGTVAILDVLGTIVVPVMSKFLSDGKPVTEAVTGITLTLPPELSESLVAAAAERQLSPEALALELLDAGIRRPAAPLW
jgi:hypothetical protein